MQSEVARLLAQIETEYDAAKQGLQGLTQGMSQHDFISARMERMGKCHKQLQALVGEQAMAMVAKTLERR